MWRNLPEIGHSYTHLGRDCDLRCWVEFLAGWGIALAPLIVALLLL